MRNGERGSTEEPDEDEWSGVRVLLVEDNPALRRTLARTLASYGFDVVAADSADAARATVERTGCPDLLFSDIRMAGTMNGMQLADWLRARYPGVRIILQTGFVQEDTDRYTTLRKPFSADELIAAIRAVKPGRSSRRSDQPPVSG